jgi:hypothetical protein
MSEDNPNLYLSWAVTHCKKFHDIIQGRGIEIQSPSPNVLNLAEVHREYSDRFEFLTGSFAITCKHLSSAFDEESRRCKIAERGLKKQTLTSAFLSFKNGIMISQNIGRNFATLSERLMNPGTNHFFVGAVVRDHVLDKFAFLVKRVMDKERYVLRRVPVLQESIIDIQLKAMDQAKLIKSQSDEKDKLLKELAAARKEIKTLEKKNQTLQSEVDAAKKAQLKPEGPAKKQGSIRDIQQLKKTAENATQQEAYAKTMLGRTLLENEDLKKEVQSLKAAMEALKLSYDVQAAFDF